ncbi:nickel-responsive transcriptional regulator NikR [Phreatobacter aquaticus]|uniref:Putative nickel-responsive regulator n=1 Tax=Phreatobacter aquaticus TaxID=2570229 RepID=A0A4D7QS52_9HYPH|nr:nickel-responsive transcriptional regulator NikR [Phreatobacter aquaticus]QCK88396.1 nickel-responsive transcriptional regulator NikR [Phreatobacter aquaticus]
MQRITISIDDALLETVDRLGRQRGYQSRSEAMRDIVREAAVADGSVMAGDAPCMATLTFVFEHETRDLARRLTLAQHDHHELSVSTLHVHVDHRDCLEVMVLRGTVYQVKAFADAVITQRGVRHGSLHLIPIDSGEGHGHPHLHGHGAHQHHQG